MCRYKDSKINLSLSEDIFYQKSLLYMFYMYTKNFWTIQKFQKKQTNFCN